MGGAVRQVGRGRGRGIGEFMAASIVAGQQRKNNGGKCVVQPNNKLIISIILAPDLGANTKADLAAAYVCRGVCVWQRECVCVEHS